MSEPKTKKMKPSSAGGSGDARGWDSLVPDVLVHLLSYASDPNDLRSASIVNRATHDAVRRETERGLDGMRLAYLNVPDGLPDRFGRLIELPLDDPTEVSSFLSKSGVSSAQSVVLERMFEHNAANPSDPRFVVAGGSMLSFWRSKTETEEEKSGRGWRQSDDFGDVDVFVLENGNDRHRSDEVLESALRSAGRDIERAIEEGREPTRPGGWEYGVLRNSGTLTMVTSSGDRDRRPLQVVLRRISCVEELLSFFDLDCCRFAYDGGNVLWTTVEGLRALELKRNFVGREHVENSMYCRRAIKYGYRGFDTRFGVLHPFSHLFGPKASAFCEVGDGDDGEHSEAITTDRSDWVDEGLYTTFANCSLDDLNEIMFAEDCDDDDDDELFDDAGDDWQDENGELLLRHRANRRQLKEELEESGFAPSFEIHFDAMRSDMFVHIYYQSHLKRKYNISRCYITGEWFKARGPANDDDDKNQRASHFSPRGWAINERGASADRDLTGTVAVVTGARVNIGFATTLALLRRGARVVGTTRFVADAKRRYEAEEDVSTFRDRLFLYPLDLRCVEDVQSFARFVSARHGRIHLLVNNAAQTVRLPLRCYVKLIRDEYLALAEALRRARRPSVAGETQRDGNDVDAALSIDCARIESDDRPTSDTAADSSTGAEEVEAASDAESDRKNGNGDGSAESSAASRDPPSDGSPSEALSLLKSAVTDVAPPGGEASHLYAPPPELTSALRDYPSLESLPAFERSRVDALRRMFANLHPDDRLGFPGGIVPDDPLEDGRNDDGSCSWNLRPTEIHPVELFETQTINHLSPTMLLNGLVPCLAARPGDDGGTAAGPSYVINVTSAEGQFSVDVKESTHVHTNMSKAALNMLTRSGASFYARKGILVNSVDTGWISSTTKTWKEPPLTAMDGAMRILHPVLTKSMDGGKLYKNYDAVPW